MFFRLSFLWSFTYIFWFSPSYVDITVLEGVASSQPFKISPSVKGNTKKRDIRLGGKRWCFQSRDLGEKKSGPVGTKKEAILCKVSTGLSLQRPFLLASEMKQRSKRVKMSLYSLFSDQEASWKKCWQGKQTFFFLSLETSIDSGDEQRKEKLVEKAFFCF